MKRILLLWFLIHWNPSLALIRGLKQGKKDDSDLSYAQHELARTINQRHGGDTYTRTGTTAEQSQGNKRGKKDENGDEVASTEYTQYSSYASVRQSPIPNRMEGAFLGGNTPAPTIAVPPATGTAPVPLPCNGGASCGGGRPTCYGSSCSGTTNLGGKGGKKSKRKGGGKGGGKGVYTSPIVMPTSSPPTPSSGGDGTGSCNCQVQQVELDFVMTRPNMSIPIAQGSPATTIGTQFIYNDGLFDLNLTALPGTFLSGMCWRTQLARPLGVNNTLVGAGHCQFTLTISQGGETITFNAMGEVFDVLGGTLAIAGGTGDLLGAYGSLEVVPVYENPGQQSHFFLEAAIYVGSATLMVPIRTSATSVSLGVFS